LQVAFRKLRVTKREKRADDQGVKRAATKILEDSRAIAEEAYLLGREGSEGGGGKTIRKKAELFSRRRTS